MVAKSPMRMSASLVALAVVLGCFTQPVTAQEKPKDESLADALTKGSWKVVIDLAPRGDKPLPAFHDRPGTAGGFTVKDGKIAGTYAYAPALGVVKAKLEGEIGKDGSSVSVKFTEQGLIAAKGIGSFDVKRDKAGKITALEGWWQINPAIDPKLKWHLVREEPPVLKAAVKEALENSSWKIEMQIPAQTFLDAAKTDEQKKAAKEFVGDKKFIPFPGAIRLKKADGVTLMEFTLQKQPKQEQLVLGLKAEKDTVVSFQASGPEFTNWILRFELDKDGKVKSVKGHLKNSRLDVDVTFEQEAAPKK